MDHSCYNVCIDCEEDYTTMGRTKNYSASVTVQLPEDVITTDSGSLTARRALGVLFGKTYNGVALNWHYDKQRVPYREVDPAAKRLTFYSTLGVYTVHLCPIFRPTSGYIAGFASRDMTGLNFNAMVGKCFAVESETTDGYIAALEAYVERFMSNRCFRIAGLVEHKSGGNTYAAVTLSYDRITTTLMAIFTSDIFIAR